MPARCSFSQQLLQRPPPGTACCTAADATIAHCPRHPTDAMRRDLSGNKLSGALPAQWSTMAGISEVSLYSNQLTGALPAQWSKFVSAVSM
jgi:hypothetical protein